MERKDKVRAVEVIAEIVRQRGGSFRNKTNLYKAFWRAHVAFHELGHVKPLTRWPIVRMARGPGIDRFDAELLPVLLHERYLRVEDFKDGDETGIMFVLINDAHQGEFTSDEMAAIIDGVDYAGSCTAAEVSEKSHNDSRSWRMGKDDDVLSPFIDSIPEDDWNRRDAALESIRAELVYAHS